MSCARVYADHNDNPRFGNCTLAISQKEKDVQPIDFSLVVIYVLGHLLESTEPAIKAATIKYAFDYR